MSYDEQDQTAEVIEDYQSALDGLTMNSRFEITNLTQIARDLTNYAFPIAETLEQHIKKVPPQRKLPAMYVLDSIVKNIGTPYTLFFGKNLYSTFMDSYASVNDSTRRKMEEMLKTWKEPVPGSIDKNPVFPPDVVRPIDNALIKARTSALQAQQEQMRTQHHLLGRGGRPVAPHRNTPTPPNARQQFVQPSQPHSGVNGPRPESSLGQAGYSHHPPAQFPGPTPQPHMSTPSATPFLPPPFGSYGAPAAQPGISIDSLINEIEQLAVAARAELGRSPYDTSIQTELKALLDLQTVLKTRGAMLSQEQLVPVKTQVANLAVKYRASNAHQTATPTPPMHGAPFHAPMRQQQQHPPQQLAPVAPVPSASAPPGSVSLDALLGKGALAALLSRRSATPQAPTPQPPPHTQTQTQPANMAALRSPPPQRAEMQKPATADPMALLGALRGVGLLPPTPQAGGTPVSNPSGPPPQAPANKASVTTPAPAAGGVPLPSNLASILASARNLAASATPPPVIITSGNISLMTSSLKEFRPYLIPTIYDALGPPCTQCGRRFKTGVEGRKRKTAHMDWHFRVHQRIVEAEKRGQHRSWYVDQEDWIKSREAVDDNQADADAEADAANNAAASAANSLGPKIQYIPVPEDRDNNSTVCPICQEKFVTKWLDEAQEWVWTDATRMGGRAYHASCYMDVTGDGRSTPKRKAETSSFLDGRPSKIRG
ncbi:hypothetical protein DHEL01_v212008 [Diaporthe helianthi]|uniref:CID domain-containing protein n=1 Tax=Diaporthe helianthi TaxID=158607 RepID=A0A2P5HH79_DIAHE|nr:hypothetical protein DHEL01_v212008 [Diaporthe helianthi]